MWVCSLNYFIVMHLDNIWLTFLHMAKKSLFFTVRFIKYMYIDRAEIYNAEES